MPSSPSTVTARLRTALAASDCTSLGDMLHPNVHWGAPDGGSTGCRNRAEVLGRCALLYDRGLRVTVEETITCPGAVVLAVRVRKGDDLAPPDSVMYQVFHLADGWVARIEGYTERREALGAACPDAET